METTTRIHLGSGCHYWPGFVNVDFDERADVVQDVMSLSSWEDGTVDEIHAIHLFEHLDRMHAENILREWARPLKTGGKLVLELPCLEKISKMVVDGVRSIGLTTFGIFGDIRLNNPHMLHKWCYTSEELKDLMEKAGFNVTVKDPAYHVEQRDMRLEGVKI